MTFRYTGSGAGLRLAARMASLSWACRSAHCRAFSAFLAAFSSACAFFALSSTACFLTFQAGVVFTTTVFLRVTRPGP
ncbi:hypothetical protein, partial [Enterobacter hormaechei]|uniref:hypothetical protein n=1 Tax=Enterobacter hormaechei TaxID=158836 RepID=UPI003F42573E